MGPDILRVLVMFLGGLCLALKYPILKQHVEVMHWVRVGRLRFDDVAIPLLFRSLAHATAIIYILIVVGARLREPITWRLYGAGIVFTLTAVGLIETHLKDQAVLGAIRKDVDPRSGDT